MRLQSLELSGFKSFGKKTTLEFPASIIEIVGPNGSGKSNVAEAFRFVLGEQSIKSLRGKKGEDLIFNGSDSAGRSNRAQVKVTFDNSDRFLDIDFNTVVIERIVHRDGANMYRVNGSTVRLKDVMELLAGAHIGASGYHIISQGEADKMLSMNARERRDVIEEALGLRVYQYRIRESERKLAKTQTNMREVELQRAEIAPHMKYLKSQVDKIEKARVVRDELLEKYREYLKREEVYLEHAHKYVEDRIGNLEQEYHNHQEVLVEARKHVADDVSSAHTEAIARAHDERRRVRTERDELLRALGTIEGEIRSYERMQKTEPAHKSQAGEISISYKQAQAWVADVRARIDEALQAEDITAVRSILQKLRDRVSELIQVERNDEPEHDIQVANNVLADLAQQKADIEEKLKACEVREADIARQITGHEDARQKEYADKEEEKRRVLACEHALERCSTALEHEQEHKRRIDREQVRFEEELQEAGVLVGSYVLKYQEFVPEGETLDESVLDESARTAQEERRRVVEKLKIRLEGMQVSGADEVVREYETMRERDEFLMRELDDLQSTQTKLESLIDELESTLSREFYEGVKTINDTFNEFFTLMFGGGSASIELIKLEKRVSPEEAEDNDEEYGVDMSIALPRKKIRGLHMLSGGERTLTSLALLFAMTQITPPPFLILDETDAALDEANSRRYGEMIKRLAKHSQLIIITHNRETMAHADVLYGVTMAKEGVSKILSIKFEDIEEKVS